MNNEIIENGDVVYYVLRVNGQNMTGKLESKMVAEMEKQNNFLTWIMTGREQHIWDHS